MSQLFSSKIRQQEIGAVTATALEAVQGIINNNQGSFDKTGLTKAAISIESIDTAQAAELGTALESYRTALTAMANDLKIEVSKSQLDAAACAAVALADPTAFVRGAKVVTAGQGGLNKTFVGMEGLTDGRIERHFGEGQGLEAYDERNNRDATFLSVTYNLRAGRQNPFGELFFPTVVVSPDNVGVAVTIRLTQVYDDFKRDIGGSLAAYKKRNVIRAFIDSTILKNDQTRVVPVYRAQAAANFVTEVAPYDTVLEGETIRTAPLKCGAEFDLLGLSQTEALVANGLMDAGDSLEAFITLENVYVKVGADVIRVRVAGQALNNFVASPQDNYKRHNLAFNPKALVLNKNTKQADSSALVTLAPVKDNDLIAVFEVNMNGYVNIERGDTQVFGNSIKLSQVIDPVAQAPISLTSGAGKTIADAFGTATVIGYDLKAYRSNLNKRQRGQLLDNTYYTQQWAVPLRSPISVLRPATTDAATDAADLSSLVETTMARTSNEAVTTLLATRDLLKDFIDNRAPDSVPSDLFGVARFLLEPTLLTEELDVSAVINSIQSHERAKDIQAVLVNKIRDIGYRLFRDSGFQAVVESGAAGVESNPVIMVGTDPMTARYLMVDGDTRVAGPDFAYQVVTTPDKRFEGQLVIALGYPEQTGNGLNPIHFGAMLWSPEITLSIPVSRSGSVNKELSVSPRFRHIVNVPVLGFLTVKNIPQVVSTAVAVPFHSV